MVDRLDLIANARRKSGLTAKEESNSGTSPRGIMISDEKRLTPHLVYRSLLW
ncbi:MAG: hypothetical protein VST70_04680 [Nitrospirota bacterium]|nr:hypothetical protein [Nitrospirota bacterium]